MEHVHESPAVMTVPLLVLAVGAVFAGWSFRDELIGADWQAFWGDSIVIAGNNHVLAQMEDVPGWVSALPTVVGLARHRACLCLLHVLPRLPVRLAAEFGGVYRFLLNKWYFDELYDVSSCDRLSRLPRSCGTSAMRRSSTASRMGSPR